MYNLFKSTPAYVVYMCTTDNLHSAERILLANIRVIL